MCGSELAFLLTVEQSHEGDFSQKGKSGRGFFIIGGHAKLSNAGHWMSAAFRGMIFNQQRPVSSNIAPDAAFEESDPEMLHQLKPDNSNSIIRSEDE